MIRQTPCSYSTVIKVYAESWDVSKAEHWMSKMLRACVEADISTYTTEIKASSEAYDVARAEHWMSMIFNAGVEASTISCNIVITAFANEAETELSTGCRVIFQAVVEADAISYSTVG